MPDAAEPAAQQSPTTEAPPAPHCCGGWRAASLLGMIAVVAAAGFWLLSRLDRPTPTPPGMAAESKPAAPADSDDRTWTDAGIRAGLLGQWERTADYGHVLLTLREDRTGGMLIHLSGLNRALVGERLDVDIVWEVEGGQVVFESLRGRPAAAFAMVSAIKGDRREREVLELTEQRLVFDDQDDREHEIWTRPAGR